MESKVDVKSEIIDISGNGVTGAMSREALSFPDWIGQFTEDCTRVCCTRCSEQLDELMEKFIVHIKTEVPLCAPSPNRSALIANRMFKKMYFFYTYYVDIKEVYVMSLWNEHMSKLMPLYCQFEMKSANRLHRGKETDGMICMRIMNALWIYFAGNKEHIIHVLLRVQNYSRKYKDIFDPIFRKMLVTNKPNRTYTDLEYIRNLLAFKLWKRLYFRHDKKAISDLALTELVPPQSFIMNYRKYKFLPCYANKPDVNNFLVTVLFDLDAAIREYFAYIDNKKIRSFDSDFHHNEKKSFISDFCASFSSHDNNMDELTNHVHDNFTLDDVKQETETIRIDEDDDLIIIDPDPEPVAPRTQPTAFTSSGTLDVIDLTADEPDMPSASSAETPSWCQNLIKLSKERVEEPPPSPTVVVVVEAPPTPEESQETEEILRENLCNTPLDIMEDSNMSEANSVGLTEITSTSQTVQDSVLDSNTPNGFQPTESQFVEKLTISEVREVHQESDEFEHVDSTSNFNDEECEPDVEAPTVKTYVVESTVQQTQEGIVCSEVISEIIADQADTVSEVDQQQQPVSAVSNSAFEQFVSEQVVTETEDQVEPAVSESVIQEPEVNVSDYTPSLRDSLDSDDIPDEDDSCQTNRLEMEQDLQPSSEPSPEPVLQDKDAEEEMYSQTETDELTSPMMEPISGNDFANYLSSLNSESYDDLQRDFITTAGELTVNRKRKNGERVVRTYNSVKARTPKVDIPETEPRKSVISDKTTERRVPLNGEKVVRFADDLWEPVYTKSFKLSKREMACFTPEVRIRKRRYYDELLEEDEQRVNAERGQGTANEIREYVQPPIVFEPQYTHLLPAYNAKTILERQDYLKDEKQQRAVVQKRPHFAANNNFLDPSTSYEKKLPDVVQTKKRGTDLNINLSIPKFESLSLNSSFQHHFCADISTCSSSACYTPPNTEPVASRPSESPRQQSQPQIETRVYPPHPQAQSVLPQQPPPLPAKPSPPPVLAQPTPPPPPPVVLAQPTPQPVLQQVSQSTAEPYTQQPVNYKTDTIIVTSTSRQLPTAPPTPVSVANVVVPPPQTSSEPPILPAQVPYWHTVDFTDHSPTYDLSAQTLESNGPNLLVNINLDQSNADHEIHLPIKKRRVSSLKVEIKDEISYPPTPMISIAELENMKTEGNIPNVGRPFKTPAELKEVPPLPASYMCNISTVPNHVVTDNFNINHTYNNPTINYHVNNVPVINFQYTPHYQLPALQPIILPVNRTTSVGAAVAASNRAGHAAAAYGYVKIPTAGKSAQTHSGGSSKRRSGTHSSSRTTERKEKKSKRT